MDKLFENLELTGKGQLRRGGWLWWALVAEGNRLGLLPRSRVGLPGEVGARHEGDAVQKLRGELVENAGKTRVCEANF